MEKRIQRHKSALLSLEPWLLFQTYKTQTSNDERITSEASTDITSIASTFKTADVNFPEDIKNPV